MGRPGSVAGGSSSQKARRILKSRKSALSRPWLIRGVRGSVIAPPDHPWDTSARTRAGRPFVVLAVPAPPSTPGRHAEDRRRLMTQLFAVIGATAAALLE